MISSYLNFDIVIITGIITLISLLSTVTMGFLVQKGKINPIYHKRMALTTAAIGLFHGTIGFIVYFGL